MRSFGDYGCDCAPQLVQAIADRDFGDELDSILQMYVDDNLSRGMTPEEARRQAHIRLGCGAGPANYARPNRTAMAGGILA